MVLTAAGAVVHHIPRDQAHPAPGSLAELEQAFAWLEESRAVQDRSSDPGRGDRALDVALRLVYRELVQRAATSAETAAARQVALIRLCVVEPLTESELRAIDGNR